MTCTIGKTLMGVGMFLIYLAIPTYALADKNCAFTAQKLQRIGVLRQTGSLFILTDTGVHHSVCVATTDGDRCRDLQALVLGAYLRGVGLTLRYGEDNYNCGVNWGGINPSPPVRYLYFDK